MRRWRDVLGSERAIEDPCVDPAHAADPPDAGHGLLRCQAMRDQRVDEAARPFVMRVQEPRRLRAGEGAAVEAGERDPLGLAFLPAEGLERLFAATQMSDHRPSPVTSARSTWR